MKVKVVNTFHDAKNFAKVYKTGDVVEFTDERAEALGRLGLVETFSEEEKPKRGRKKQS